MMLTLVADSSQLIIHTMRLILASSSPRRAELLAAAGFVFEVMPTDVDERVRANERPDEYVRRLAAEKSALAMERIGGHGHGEATEDLAADESVVLGADTSVVVDGEILGKPMTDEEARSMLQSSVWPRARRADWCERQVRPR